LQGADPIRRSAAIEGQGHQAPPTVAERADDYLNRERAKRGLPPKNYSASGPVNASICLDCEFNPLFGGACQMAPARVVEESSDV
jgi:hypothetical protein